MSNTLNIRLLKGCKKGIKYMIEYVNNGRNRIKMPIDLSIKNEFTVLFYLGILSYYSYIDLEKMKIKRKNIRKDK